MNEIKIKLGELFCGPGGIALGARDAQVVDEQNGIRYTISHTWANDYHPDTCETYARNFPEVNVICSDVNKLEITSLENIDAFAYGFPCNDFSLLGEYKGLEGKYGGLYTHGIDVLNKFNPQFFIAENVSGILGSDDGKAFELICSELSSAGKHGYNLSVHKYKFEEYGIPQKRHRIIIVGLRNDLNKKFKIPSPTHTDSHITVRQTLENPPLKNNAYNHDFPVQTKRVVERLKHIKPGENAWTADIPKELQLNVKGAKLSQIYKRLHPDEASYTITGSGGGGTHGYHYKEPRALTNRERARIQSFPDDFIFHGSKESIRRQIGMAVSPAMSKIIFEAILKTIAGIDYEHVS